MEVDLEPWERPPTNRAIGELERLAYDRHRRDRETAETRGLWFDAAAAERVVWFMRLCRHSKGRWAGQTFEPSIWQEFFVRSLFGWKRVDSSRSQEEWIRRYRYAYLQVGSKNGKSTLIAPVALYLTLADHEAGAEVYSTATTRAQARLVFDEAARMARRSDGFKEFLQIFGGQPQSRTNNISCEFLASKFEPLAADDQTADGINPHAVLIDELHRWTKRGFYELLFAKLGAREQPLVIQITTAGAGRDGICWETRDYCQKVLEGIVEDDEYFAFIAEPDPESDWQDERAWEQGNPNLDVTIKREDLRKDAVRAAHSLSKQNDFRRLRCNQWTEQIERWLPMELWPEMGGGIDERLLKGRPCFAGLDLAATTDIATVCYWFPPLPGDGHDHHRLIWRAWKPEDRILQASHQDRKPFLAWKDKGWLETTPGDVIDYAWIEERIIKDRDELGFDILEMGFDPWNATAIVNRLQDVHGFTMVKVSQGVGGLSAASKEFERLWLRKVLRHGDNPIARWCSSNVAIWKDPNENIKPSRKSSGGRIDLVVAGVIALSRAMLTFEAESVYETRGLG
jgi:phage terminase large subunit-like protein